MRLPSAMTMGAAALAYASELGWAVFPCVPGGKVPLVERGCLEATTDAAQIAAWWEKWPNANIGVATGATSKIVVVDVDGPEGEQALGAFGELPNSPVSLTGKGRHLFFAAPLEGMRNSAKKLGPQLDTRGDGGYVVVPPSVHPDGHRYEWHREHRPSRQALPDVPAPILNRLRAATAPVAVAGTTVSVASTIPFQPAINNGTRDDTMTALAGRLLAKGHGELETLALLRGVNATKCVPPLEEHDLERIVRSIGGAERRKGLREWRGEYDEREPVTPPMLTRVDLDVLEALGDKNLAPINAVPTMLPDWNDACRGDGGSQGVACGWHIMIAGSTGTGKSLLALNLAAAAIKAGRTVAYVSFEMSRDQLLSRFLAIYAGHNVRELEKGPYYSPQAYARVAGEFRRDCNEMGGELVIAERPRNTVESMVSTATAAIDAGAAMVIVDYIQRVGAASGASIYEQMRQASNAIQRVAYESGGKASTVALSQYNRATSFNKDAPPTVQGMTGGSDLENDSDQVALLDHTKRKRVGNRSEGKVLLAKNRHGPEVDIPVVWDYTTLRVMQAAPDPMDRTEHRHGL